MKNTLRVISNENEVNKSTKEDIETLNLKKMSFLLKETNESINFQLFNLIQKYMVLKWLKTDVLI